MNKNKNNFSLSLLAPVNSILPNNSNIFKDFVALKYINKIFTLFTLNPLEGEHSNPLRHPQQRIKTVNLLLEDLNQVNEKGFVKITDILSPNSIFPTITKFFNDLEYRGSIATTEKRFQLWMNLIFVNLYFQLLQIETDLKDEEDDLRADLKNLILKIYSRLDPSIRIKIQKRGITVIQNIYTGYDSEFVLQDVKKHLNKLLTVQIAVNSRTIIKIPLNKSYEISYVHPLTSNISSNSNYKSPQIFTLDEEDLKVNENENENKNKNKEKEIKAIELEILEESIRYAIDQIRSFKYSNHDILLTELIETLRESNGITFYEDELKDQIVFALPRTPILSKVIFSDENPQLDFSFDYLLKTSNSLSDSSLIEGYSNFLIELKSTMPSLQLKATMAREVETGSEEIIHRQRTTYSLGLPNVSQGPPDKLSVSRIKNNHFCSHLTNADLSILTDFPTLKEQLNIVQKSFVTLGKPLLIDNSFVYIRDTMLLAPAGNRSLEALGKLYNFPKIEISKKDKKNMEDFLKKERGKFKKNAQQNAEITLKHTLLMEDFNIQLKNLGVPITLSSLGRKYVIKKWSDSEILKKGRYQVSSVILLGNTESVQTPKGLKEIGNIGLFLSYYIANYKGGRNESFMYGVDDKTLYYDYDLISAYTTSMANLTLPSYNESTILPILNLEEWDLEKYLNNYIIIKGFFNFPNNTKYPSIPCYLDGKGTVTVYPLSGQCLLKGPEYYLAKLQGCEIQIESIVNTPPKKISTKIGNLQSTEILKPFYKIIKEILTLRNNYPKGDIMNLLYKEIGNSIYGNVVRGIADKRKFDIKTGKNLRIDSTELSNPLLASLTTGFIRSVIGECLHNINRIGGKVVSVTTDGFITDVKDLEEKLLKLKSGETPLFTKYMEIRATLSGNSTALEIKHSGKGIISWTTRGQLGIESKIKATTGFQSFGYSREELINFFKKVLGSKEKYFEYTQSSLRGANEIYKKGGHVTMTFKEQIFRLMYDNRRQIIDLDPKNNLGLINSFDSSNILFDSMPLNSVLDCSRLRFISYIHRNSIYNKNTSKSRGNAYKRSLEIAVKNFIKGYLSKDPLFGLKGNEFKNYKEILEFIHGYEPAKNIHLSSQSLSNLKHRKMILKPVVRKEETLGFINYVQTKIETFNEKDFFKD